MKSVAGKTSRRQYLAICLFVLAGVTIAVYDFRLTLRAVDSQQPLSFDFFSGGEPVQPLPLALDLDPARVALGEKLYHDPRLSGDNSISCATCHDLGKGGTDQLPLSAGIGGGQGALNSPTTFNSGFNFVQFWDGRARTLAQQAAGPVHNPVEMGSSWPEVIGKLNGDPGYLRDFAAVYPDGITADNIVDAIAVFEMSLLTPNSPFDRFLRGEESAISARAREGYRLFKEYGCVACHQGINIGGNMYQTIGVMDNYFTHRDPGEADRGRYNVTGNPWNLHQFKVPTLRNIALTFPYLHDGSAATLEDVLKVMWNSQLGRNLEREESELIIAFLRTLTGEYRGQAL